MLLIDADPQGSALDWAAAREGEPLFSVVGFPRPTINSYPLPVLKCSVTQRVVFAEAAVQGRAVHELGEAGPAAIEIDSVRKELMEFALMEPA